jgi:hypothetical protein
VPLVRVLSAVVQVQELVQEPRRRAQQARVQARVRAQEQEPQGKN